MNINEEQLKELIIELINFMDTKVSKKEITTKSCGYLKYKIYTSNKNIYYYNNYLIKGSIGHGNLSKDTGIAFLLGDNKIKSGIYVYLSYNRFKQEICVKLGSSYQSEDPINLEIKNIINNEHMVTYCKNFNYFEITNKINKLLDVSKEKLINLKNYCQENSR